MLRSKNRKQLKQKIMEKYIVRVHILKSDKIGNMNSESSEYSFQEPKLIEARNKAIAKVRELEELFNYGMPEDSKFSSPLEAQLKGFENFNAFSIELSFVPYEGSEYQIYGEEELTIESLAAEANFYLNGGFEECTEVEDLDGEIVEVLESNLDFFIK
jgi:hypothetical protein